MTTTAPATVAEIKLKMFKLETNFISNQFYEPDKKKL